MAARGSAGRQRYHWLLLLLVAVLLLAWLFTDGGGQDGADRGRATTTSTSSPASASGLPTLQVADLPPEVAQTLELIDDGGPFSEDRDGVTFENREALLPDRPRGYYREYTVPTPGSDDRGARRIVAGQEGDLYYTGDHYGTFASIAR